MAMAMLKWREDLKFFVVVPDAKSNKEKAYTEYPVCCEMPVDTELDHSIRTKYNESSRKARYPWTKTIIHQSSEWVPNIATNVKNYTKTLDLELY
mmetsp:Transcript_14424/g.19244  ORF Transcript_14424/g.19244 Transcript_14424/m.19244 type:complete len:95 (-) Transcript_14424:238-522(-)